jgi:hypothetical protein
MTADGVSFLRMCIVEFVNYVDWSGKRSACSSNQQTSIVNKHNTLLIISNMLELKQLLFIGVMNDEGLIW